MTLGTEFVYWQNSQLAAKNKKTDSSKLVAFGTILEYDTAGKLVWSWKSSDYFKKSDYRYYMDRENRVAHPHENAFFFDELKNVIYLSCRDISRVIKIKYPEGTVLNIYGELFKPAGMPLEQNYYSAASIVAASLKTTTYTYSTTIVAVRSPSFYCRDETACIRKRLVEKNMEFECPSVSAIVKRAGGNVTELPDNSFFASSCNPYSILFIVNLDKNILWSALPEKWNAEEKKWQPIDQYRASIILNRQELERLIWGGENK